MHMWTQIIGKTRLALSPMTNHWWNVPLYVTARGLGTSPIVFGTRAFDVELDLVTHEVHIRTTEGDRESFAVSAVHTVAEFHAAFFLRLTKLGITVLIQPLAVEIPETILLDRDDEPRRYDPEIATRFFHALLQADRLLKEFRGHFTGKASPVHFFWGSFDLAVSRFSGRRGPRFSAAVPHCRPSIMVEAYSHEVSSAGFWPGGPAHPEPIFYAYAYPEPAGFPAVTVAPKTARYSPELREFILPYAAVRASRTPDDDVRAFLSDTYEAAAELGDWPRQDLERKDDYAPSL
jgi:hypothetical protein